MSKAEMVTGDSSVGQAPKGDNLPFHLQTLGPEQKTRPCAWEYTRQEQGNFSLTQLGVAKTEHTAVCPVDHRLDHLCHSSSTHFSLANTRRDTRSEWTISDGNGSPLPGAWVPGSWRDRWVRP